MGHKSVAQAQRCISLREFERWKIYYSVEPFGEQRADLRAAQIICWLSNTLGNLKRQIQVSDVLPFLDQSGSHTSESLEDARYRRGCELEGQMRRYTTDYNWHVEAAEAKGKRA